jgi:hypothetical protein
MKAKVIIVVMVVLVGGLAAGGYFYYDLHLRFQDDYTDCPVKAFRTKVDSPADVDSFAKEETYGSLANTEKCSLDCRKGNAMACAVYGLAMQAGVFIMKSEEGSKEFYKKACDKGEDLGCALLKRVDELKEERARAKARAEEEKAKAEKVEAIQKVKQGAALRRQQALAHFKGSAGPMSTASMLKWHEDTVQFLLYDKPLLSKMHQLPGNFEKGLGLKAFVTAKYLRGSEGLKMDLMKEFFDKFRRLGVKQIRLDHYVEKKKESEIPKNHDYFKGKHTFLYHVAEVELDILDAVEKEF